MAVIKFAIPLIIYFAIKFFISFLIAKAMGTDYSQNTSAFTSSGNNSELAIAVTIGLWGINSGEAYTAAFWLRNKFYSECIVNKNLELPI